MSSTLKAPAILLPQLICVICGVKNKEGETGSMFPLQNAMDRPDASPAPKHFRTNSSQNASSAFHLKLLIALHLLKQKVTDK